MADEPDSLPEVEEEQNREDDDRYGIKVKCPYCGQKKMYSGEKETFMCSNKDECGITVDVWRGRLAYFTEQPNLRLLAHGPRTRDEFEEATGIEFRWTAAMKAMADKIEPAPSRNNASNVKVDTYPKTVYYLPGDERRAIMKFMKANPTLVKSAMNTRNNRLRQKWPDWAYEMLVEQWEMLGLGHDGEEFDEIYDFEKDLHIIPEDEDDESETPEAEAEA